MHFTKILIPTAAVWSVLAVALPAPHCRLICGDAARKEQILDWDDLDKGGKKKKTKKTKKDKKNDRKKQTDDPWDGIVNLPAVDEKRDDVNEEVKYQLISGEARPRPVCWDVCGREEITIPLNLQLTPAQLEALKQSLPADQQQEFEANFPVEWPQTFDDSVPPEQPQGFEAIIPVDQSQTLESGLPIDQPQSSELPDDESEAVEEEISVDEPQASEKNTPIGQPEAFAEEVEIPVDLSQTLEQNIPVYQPETLDENIPIDRPEAFDGNVPVDQPQVFDNFVPPERPQKFGNFLAAEEPSYDDDAVIGEVAPLRKLRPTASRNPLRNAVSFEEPISLEGRSALCWFTQPHELDDRIREAERQGYKIIESPKQLTTADLSLDASQA
jgi:hypothetical protein